GSDQTGATMVLHYDGSGWSRIATPSIGPVNAISAHAPYDVWMVSDSTIAHFDGTAWKVIAAPDLLGGQPASFNGIVARSETDVRVAGYHGGGEPFVLGHTYLAGMLCATRLMAAGISPKRTQAAQGGSVHFVVPRSEAQYEVVADASPLGLFESDRIEPGHS